MPTRVELVREGTRTRVRQLSTSRMDSVPRRVETVREPVRRAKDYESGSLTRWFLIHVLKGLTRGVLGVELGVDSARVS